MFSALPTDAAPVMTVRAGTCEQPTPRAVLGDTQVLAPLPRACRLPTSFHSTVDAGGFSSRDTAFSAFDGLVTGECLCVWPLCWALHTP